LRSTERGLKRGLKVVSEFTPRKALANEWLVLYNWIQPECEPAPTTKIVSWPLTIHPITHPSNHHPSFMVYWWVLIHSGQSQITTALMREANSPVFFLFFFPTILFLLLLH
jgi:hypothetical protein